LRIISCGIIVVHFVGSNAFLLPQRRLHRDITVVCAFQGIGFVIRDDGNFCKEGKGKRRSAS
jgi:hypothetical protein